VLLLADLEGLALQEIAQIMEIPVGTVKSRLFRARRMVRRRLPDYRKA
jgi:RNA polymerase sigma-70 factor (ECF subfamily)